MHPAAWTVTNICKQPGKVGMFVGGHRYLCQDICEVSFRSCFHQHTPSFQVLEPLTTMDNGNFAYENTLDLVGRKPELVGLYVPAAESEASCARFGNWGLIPSDASSRLDTNWRIPIDV